MADIGDAAGPAASAAPSPIECDLCGVRVSSDVQLQQHRAGKAHKKRAQEVQESEHRVHLSGFPPETSAASLEASLSLFGTVVALSLHSGFAFLTFERVVEREQAVAAGTTPLVTVGGVVGTQTIRIRPAFVGHPTRDRKAARSRDVRSELAALAKGVREVGKTAMPADRFQRQLEALVQLREPPRSARDESSVAVAAVCDLITGELGPAVVALPYGSHVTGLGGARSDVDITVITKGVAADETVTLLERVHDAAIRSPLFLAYSVTRGKCPVVALSHLPTGTKVEISINNRLALRNTALLRAYIDHFPFIRLHIHAVRAWLQGANLRLSGYAVSVSVVAHLIHSGVVPNLQNQKATCNGSCGRGERSQLTSDSDNERPMKRLRLDKPGTDHLHDVDGWETWFCCCAGKSGSMQSPSLEVFASYFDFLAKNCAGSTAISLRAGGTIPLNELHCESSLFTVEDPFELSHNLTRSFSEDSVSVLSSRAVAVADVLRKTANLDALFSRPHSKVADASASLHDVRVIAFSVPHREWTTATFTDEIERVLRGMNLHPESIDRKQGFVNGVVLRTAWRGSRQARRQAARVSSDAGLQISSNAQDPPASVPEVTACFVYKVSLIPGEEVFEVQLRQSDITNLDSAQEFSALFKQRINMSCKNRFKIHSC